MAAESPAVQKPSPIRALREAQGLSLRELARRADVDHAQLGRIERGEAVGSIATLRKLAKALGMTDFADTLALYDGEPR